MPAHADTFERFGSVTRSEFIAGAQSVGGLTKKQASSAWSDESLRWQIPVSTTDEKVTESGGFSALSTSKTHSFNRKFISGLGIELLNMFVTQTFSYDGSRAYLGSTSVLPWTNPVTEWSYTGITQQQDYYLDAPYGRAMSERTGTWRFDPPGYLNSVMVTMEGRYNGISNAWGSQF